MDDNRSVGKTLEARISSLPAAGTIAIVTGTIGAVVTTVAAVLWRLETAHPMPYEIVLVLLGVSGGAVGFGLLERINRPTRTAVVGLVARLEQMEATINDLNEQVADLKETISQLPAYGQGVIDGIQMHHSAGVPHHD
jgi:hypothetical protein